MGMRLDPETTRRVLAMAEPQKTRREKEYVDAGVSIEPRRLVLTIPHETKSEANQRDRWGKIKRTKSVRKILQQTIWPYHSQLTKFVEAFHGGGLVTVTFTRLGGRQLDDDNLRSSMKAARDTVASLLLADDGDPRFCWRYAMKPGGPVGVMVELNYD